MKTILLFRQGTLCMISSMFLYAGVANAQSNDIINKTAVSEVPEQNPFDFALNAAENQEQQKDISTASKAQALTRAKLPVQSKANLSKSNDLQYRKQFSGTSVQAKRLYKTLVAKYGQPKSVRGQSHVWDIQNPSRGGDQADIVTIILKMGKNSGYELIMDRDRGADGRATWAAPRITPKPKQEKKQNAKQHQPLLQPDND